jgi:hypothetical protein
MELGSPTLVVVETQHKTPVGMEIDVLEGGQVQQDEDVGNILQPKILEEAPTVNGTVLDQEESTTAERSHTTTLEQPQEGTVEYVISWAEEYAEERTM